MEKSYGTKALGLDIGSINIYWQFYIYKEDFPEIPNFTEKYGITIHVKQYQYLNEKYKGQSKTIFWTDKNKAWDKNINDKNKKLIIEKIEKTILEGSHELIGKNIDPIIVQYIPQSQEIPYTGMFFA